MALLTKPRVKNNENKRGRGTKKTPVVGVKERSTKHVHAQAALPNAHVSVNHSVKQYADGGIHTNNIENFWPLVKKQYHGTHHHYSVKYTQMYIDEMCFRQNNRENGNMFNTLLRQSILADAA